jgi:hypothetical protein
MDCAVAQASQPKALRFPVFWPYRDTLTSRLCRCCYCTLHEAVQLRRNALFAFLFNSSTLVLPSEVRETSLHTPVLA